MDANTEIKPKIQKVKKTTDDGEDKTKKKESKPKIPKEKAPKKVKGSASSDETEKKPRKRKSADEASSSKAEPKDGVKKAKRCTKAKTCSTTDLESLVDVSNEGIIVCRQRFEVKYAQIGKVKVNGWCRVAGSTKNDGNIMLTHYSSREEGDYVLLYFHADIVFDVGDELLYLPVDCRN